jgi:heavy metal sensor kinase
MRSIRLSLLVFFLVLLAAALGTVSVLVYRISKENLADKNRLTRELIARQYQDMCAKERARLDEELLADAKTLARHAQIQVDAEALKVMNEGQPGPRRLGVIAATVAGTAPNGIVATSLWATQAANVLTAQQRWPVVAIKVDESELHANDPAGPTPPLVDYLQVQSGFPFPGTFRSHSLDGISLALHQEVVPAREYLGPEYRDVNLEPGVSVRRVAFRYNLHMAPPANSTATGPSRPGTGPDKPFPGRGPFRVGGVVLAGYGRGRLEEALVPYQEQRDNDLARLEERTNESLATLRNRLLAISLATFVAVVIGGYLLVRLGLMPLERLGDAVSRVSEKDFRLQFDESHLPVELKPIVDRLTQTLEDLRLAFQREKQAAADISHELRTPIAALLTTIEVTLKKPRKPEEYREVLGECRESGHQISQLVERLLMLARIDAGVDQLRVEKVDVTALAEQCTALVRPLAEARGLKLRLHTEGEAVLAADPAKLREVMTNLLHNAIEYNRPDGSVDLTVARQNGTLRVEVSDTGVGIAPEARARIFERFYRADPSRHSDAPHSGLGLAIVKGYVDLMGGSIGVESAVGRGSTFRVELPAA